ncbi:MAG TPA: sensor histidine kinase [Gemmatimonadaceae bacterium]|nr:sensor histidine kinase [Gemmatimonadaceae bacterium]
MAALEHSEPVMKPQVQQPSGHIGTVLGPTDHVWRRWVENPYAFYYTPLAIATAILLFVPGHGWREQVAGVVTALATAYWFHRWTLHVRAESGRHALAHRLGLALVGVVLTSILAVIHDAYLINLLMLVMLFFMALPVSWSVFLTILIAFPTGRLYDTHGEMPDAMGEITSVLFLRVPIMVMFGIVVRTAAAQNEERRRLLDTLAAAERRAGTLEERQRLAREIHDTLAQGFAAIVMHLEQADVVTESSDPARPHLDFARSIARENLEEARRMLTALRPEVLDQEGGLAAAMQRVCSEWSKRCGVACTVNVTGDVLMLHSEVEVMLLRATQELLANVRKHAKATHVTVTLSYITDVVALDVRDDGVGFEPKVNAGGGFGLRGLRERSAQVGGTVEVESVPSEGTTVSVTIPAFRTETYPVPVAALGAAPGATAR